MAVVGTLLGNADYRLDLCGLPGNSHESCVAEAPEEYSLPHKKGAKGLLKKGQFHSSSNKLSTATPVEGSGAILAPLS